MSYITRAEMKNPEIIRAAKQINWAIADNYRGRVDRAGYEYAIPLSAYLLYKASQFSNPASITYASVIAGEIGVPESLSYMVQRYVTEEMWNRLLPLTMKAEPIVFAVAALQPEVDEFSRAATTTPESIVKLSQKILDIQADDSVVDIGCGSGSFLVSSGLEVSTSHFYGYEINSEAYEIAKMRSELLEANIEVELRDAFTLADDEEHPVFSKVFANYPFGLKMRSIASGSRYLAQLIEQNPGLSKATSSDWVFNALVCDLLAENGKAVAIMTNGSTWNSIDTPIRKYFVERRMVEAVISLPNRMFEMTNIPTTMIVLSHNNEGIRMVDATKLCQQGRRQNEFSDSDIETIFAALHEDTSYSKIISIEDLRKNEYTLSLSRYLTDGIAFANGVPFETVIKSITRGAPCTASQLDEMVSEEVTNMQYLMLANIQNGMIDDKLPYLSAIEPKYEKYCLKHNNLILSKNGYPYKVAVAKVAEGQRILANGNLYIIELDEEKVNPYYLKAFFESEQGVAVLRSITVGATIPNIGVDKLKKIEIPLPSMEEQNRIAQKYQATLDEIAVIKLRLEKAIDKLYHIFDEEGN